MTARDSLTVYFELTPRHRRMLDYLIEREARRSGAISSKRLQAPKFRQMIEDEFAREKARERTDGERALVSAEPA